MPINSTVRGSFGPQGRFGRARPDGLSPATAAVSAVWMYSELGYRTNGTYWLNPTGSNAFQAYCIMDRDGGGWVKAAQYYNNEDLSVSAAINENGTWTTRERNLASGKLRTADITALHQTKTTFLTRVYQYSAGSHRYWRYRIGSASPSGSAHFPRVARIGFTINNSASSIGTDYDIVNFVSDNCGDSGTIPTEGTSYVRDFTTPVEVHGSYISSSFGGGLRGATVFVEWSDNNSSWTTAWSGVVTNNTNQCGVIRTGTSSYDSLFAYGAGTMKYVGATNAPNWGTDQDPPGYTLSLDVSSNGSYLYSKTYTDDTRGRCTHVGDGWVFPSDHNYTNAAICWSYNKTAFSTNLHWMGGNGSDTIGSAFSGGELRWGSSSNPTSSAAIYVK